MKIKHTSNSSLKIENLGDVLNSVLKGRALTMEQMFQLDEIPILNAYDPAYMYAAYFVTNGGLLAPEKWNEAALSTTAYNTANRMQVLAHKGQGNDGQTWYSILNGGTEEWTSGQSATGAKGSDDATRWAKSEHGKCADHKEALLYFLLDSENREHYLELGKRVYDEKARNL